MSIEETIADLVRKTVREELRAALGSETLSTEQAAGRAGVSRKTVNEWIRLGVLQAGKRGRLRTIRREDLDRYLAGEREPAKAEGLLRRIG